MSAPKVGDRNTDGRPLEWTGEAWTPVCSRDDKPMAERDGEGWLCCGICGVRAVDDRGWQR